MHGAKSEPDLARISNLLDEFEILSFEETDWNALGNTLYTLRTHGLTVPFQDAIIALLAIKNDIPVLTRDALFSHIQKVLINLKLY